MFTVVIAVIAFAVTVSGLNTEKVTLNLHFFTFELSLGFLLILSLFFGLLIGLLMSLFNYYMPLKLQISKLKRQNRMVQKQALVEKRLENTDA